MAEAMLARTADERASGFTEQRQTPLPPYELEHKHVPLEMPDTARPLSELADTHIEHPRNSTIHPRGFSVQSLESQELEAVVSPLPGYGVKPVQEEEKPAHGEEQPAQEQEEPVQGVARPVQEGAKPVQEVEKPVQEEKRETQERTNES